MIAEGGQGSERRRAQGLSLLTSSGGRQHCTSLACASIATVWTPPGEHTSMARP